MAGFEPTNDGIKNRCLTTWRHPNETIASQKMSYNIYTHYDFATVKLKQLSIFLIGAHQSQKKQHSKKLYFLINY